MVLPRHFRWPRLSLVKLPFVWVVVHDWKSPRGRLPLKVNFYCRPGVTVLSRETHDYFISKPCGRAGPVVKAVLKSR